MTSKGERSWQVCKYWFSTASLSNNLFRLLSFQISGIEASLLRWKCLQRLWPGGSGAFTRGWLRTSTVADVTSIVSIPSLFCIWATGEAIFILNLSALFVHWAHRSCLHIHLAGMHLWRFVVWRLQGMDNFSCQTRRRRSVEDIILLPRMTYFSEQLLLLYFCTSAKSYSAQSRETTWWILWRRCAHQSSKVPSVSCKS